MSFEAEWSRFERSVRGYFKANMCWVCPQAGQGIVDDLVQDCALRVWKNFDPSRGLSWSYVKEAAHSVLVDCFRRCSRGGRLTLSREEMTSEHPQLPTRVCAPVDPEVLALFVKALSLLAEWNQPGEVVCFIYVRILEWSPEHVVRELGSTPVRHCLQQGLEKYADLFDDPGFRRAMFASQFSRLLNFAPLDPLASCFPEGFDGQAVTRAWWNVARGLLRKMTRTQRLTGVTAKARKHGQAMTTKTEKEGDLYGAAKLS